MANPQLEDGYTPVANDIVEALMKINLSSYESRILWFLLRKTYGWGKKTDWLTLSQFSMCIGLDRRLIHRGIKSLSSKKMIVIERDDSGHIRYGLQKDYEKWEVSSKKMTVISRDDAVSSKKMNRVSSKKIPTKETITKETITKALKDIVGQVVSYLNEKTGRNFSPLSKPTISHINARLSEGRTIEDFRTVIDRKARDWLNDPKMSPYLRPETLFGSKFEGYLNEIDHPLNGIVSSNTQKTIDMLRDWSPPP